MPGFNWILHLHAFSQVEKHMTQCHFYGENAYVQVYVWKHNGDKMISD